MTCGSLPVFESGGQFRGRDIERQDGARLTLTPHLAVGVQAEGGQAVTLDRARLVDPLADSGAVFGGGLVGQIFVRDARHFDMQIDAVE